MIRLGVNIDHVATVREARKTNEPDPVWAATLAELGGADAITIHLREDRRHIQDRDVFKLREVIKTRLNLEMANAPEIVAIEVQKIEGEIGEPVRSHLPDGIAQRIEMRDAAIIGDRDLAVQDDRWQPGIEQRCEGFPE